jgi:ubiquinone/menaquinone biosynthesis C-methylase UbiE
VSGASGASRSRALQGGFEAVDREERRERFVAYLDAVKELDAARVYRARVLELLDLQPGEAVLEVGCGTGDFAQILARQVGNSGRVVGLDASAALVEQARERVAESLPLEFRVGDAHGLDFPDACFDAACSDRVFQHLQAPDRALAELVRICRPGGRIVITEPDWGTLAVDVPDRALARKVLALLCDAVRQGWIGRQLPALFRQAGLREVTVEAHTLTRDDLGAADRLLGITSAALRFYEEGKLTGRETARWLAELEQATTQGRFFCSLTGFTVFGRC